jgi:hypothetical protein
MKKTSQDRTDEALQIQDTIAEVKVMNVKDLQVTSREIIQEIKDSPEGNPNEDQQKQ